MSIHRRAHGPTVRAVREARGLTNEAVATAAGISKAYLTNIEKGRRRPETQITGALAAALGVEVEILTGQKPAIATIREALDIEAAVLARDVGCTAGRLDRIERGTERPDADQLQLIARRLGVDPSALDVDTPAAV